MRLAWGLLNAAAILVVATLIALAVAPPPREPAVPTPGSGPAAAEEVARSPDGVRQHILQNGTAETGAFNLVTAIYLGYRAYDTLGETVVLLLSVSGIVFLVRRRT